MVNVLAKSVQVMVAAAGGTVVGVRPGESAALHGAQGAAASVAKAVHMGIAAAGGAIVVMLPGDGTAVGGAQGTAAAVAKAL